MRKTISLSLPEELDAALRAHAEEHSMTLSKLLQKLLAEYLRSVRAQGAAK